MSVKGFQKKFELGEGVGELCPVFFDFCNFFNFAKPLRLMVVMEIKGLFPIKTCRLPVKSHRNFGGSYDIIWMRRLYKSITLDEL